MSFRPACVVARSRSRAPTLCLLIAAWAMPWGALADTSGPSLPGASVASLHSWLIEHNPDLQAMALEAEAAQARVQPAGALPDPMAQIELRDIDVDQPRVLPAQVGSTFYQLRQRFPLWGKRGLARDAASADASSAGYRRDARLRELIAATEQSYVRYWYAGASAAGWRRNSSSTFASAFTAATSVVMCSMEEAPNSSSAKENAAGSSSSGRGSWRTWRWKR